ncbi:MAG: insulinase family protein [Clostridium baratii]|uniref:Processing protease n=1 Tax=Clostridium baratii str. Sullivan TaxID=1415775 RepID=A0A0A7FW58_9CLOT|nr:pitrilysin family protein [Clostridium baratii]AIY83822.1 processing protease [Clostridium baratii str. Sullivan]MBS6006760.1 insulinase family protein [Clostridium baratii]MDU1053567.1 pitrilysin family protein [Clostridium baratii]MDU4910389.1 pitrilysin family protein [Clostridium baratii]
MHKIFTLKNGLRVVMDRIDGVNSVSVGVMIQNGSRNESLNLNGISHFIEHMFFKGTYNRSAKEIAEEIENVGGQINAFTSKEATCYYIKALSTHLDISLDILSDMLLNSKFDEGDIEKEKGVVIEEINMNEDNPEDVLDNIHSKASFEENSLSYPILGTIEKIRSLTRKDILDFIEEKYTPYNSVISICGKFDEEEVIKLVEKYFGKWESKKVYTPEYEGTEIKSNSVFIKKEIEQLHIGLGIQGLPFEDERGYALVLLNNILGGGASSILFQKVREELGLCYSIYSYPQPFKKAGIVNIYVGLSKEYADKALKVIKREIENFVQNGITDEELKINKEKIKASYILGLESTSSKMFANAKSLLFRNRIRTEEDVIKKVDNISKEDIEYVLKNCFGKGIINTAYVGPEIDVDYLDSCIYKDTEAYDNSRKTNKFKL